MWVALQAAGGSRLQRGPVNGPPLAAKAVLAPSHALQALMQLVGRTRTLRAVGDGGTGKMSWCSAVNAGERGFGASEG